MNNTNTYQSGDTVRLKCTFFDFDDEPANPDSVKLIIYNFKYEVLDTINFDGNNGDNVGEYFYNFTTDKKEQRIYYEWHGEINGSVSLVRNSLATKFI